MTSRGLCPRCARRFAALALARALPRLLFATLLTWSAVAAHAGEPGSLAWIYAEANTGGSSGGHIALRVNDTVYHVQQSPSGLYQIEREDWGTFRHLYAGLQNRTLALAHFDVAEPDVERVSNQLARAYVAQRAEIERRERLALDLAWLRAWREGEAPPPLRGAGLLAPAAHPEPRALALRETVRARFGEPFLASELARLDAGLASFVTGRDEGIALRETLLLREALRALDQGWPLAPVAVLPNEGLLAEPLAPDEVAGARRHAEAEREAVLALLGSRRPDRAHALLLAMARHQALLRSAESGLPVLLDATAGEDMAMPADEQASPEAYARLAERMAEVLRDGRPTVLAAPDFDEARYNLLELGAGIWREFARGAGGGAVRKLPRRATPAQAKEVVFTPATTDAAELERALGAKREELTRQQERLASLYPYGVLNRNCVTEIARLLNDAFGPDEAERVLGAELEPGAGLTFIPFAFFEEVTSRLRVARVEIVSSYRERELARLEAEDASFAQRVAESMTLTSSIYRPRLRDGAFLFFTDDLFWRRPLLGLANLGFAAGNGVVGLAALPLDGGERALAAGSGLWYSVPELFFFNIRKGSFDWVPAEATVQE